MLILRGFPVNIQLSGKKIWRGWSYIGGHLPSLFLQGSLATIFQGMILKLINFFKYQLFQYIDGIETIWRSFLNDVCHQGFHDGGFQKFGQTVWKSLAARVTCYLLKMIFPWKGVTGAVGLVLDSILHELGVKVHQYVV